MNSKTEKLYKAIGFLHDEAVIAEKHLESKNGLDSSNVIIVPATQSMPMPTKRTRFISVPFMGIIAAMLVLTIGTVTMFRVFAPDNDYIHGFSVGGGTTNTPAAERTAPQWLLQWLTPPETDKSVLQDGDFFRPDFELQVIFNPDTEMYSIINAEGEVFANLEFEKIEEFGSSSFIAYRTGQDGNKQEYLLHIFEIADDDDDYDENSVLQLIQIDVRIPIYQVYSGEKLNTAVLIHLSADEAHRAEEYVQTAIEAVNLIVNLSKDFDTHSAQLSAICYDSKALFKSDKTIDFVGMMLSFSLDCQAIGFYMHTVVSDSREFWGIRAQVNDDGLWKIDIAKAPGITHSVEIETAVTAVIPQIPQYDVVPNLTQTQAFALLGLSRDDVLLRLGFPHEIGYDTVTYFMKNGRRIVLSYDENELVDHVNYNGHAVIHADYGTTDYGDYDPGDDLGIDIEDGMTFHDLEKGELSVSASDLPSYQLRTNSTNIRVSIPQGHEVTVTLYDAEYGDIAIIQQFTLNQSRTGHFSNLTSARNYFIVVSGDDFMVRVTE
jgi:hypothetical protein